MNQQTSTPVMAPATAPRLAVRTDLRAGADTGSNDLIEATRTFLQSLLNALPAPMATNPETPTPTTTSQPQ